MLDSSSREVTDLQCHGQIQSFITFDLSYLQTEVKRSHG